MPQHYLSMIENQYPYTPLEQLEFLPYIDNEGLLPQMFQGQIGVYAIFDQEKVLRFVGYSRDIYQSLKQHLLRQPGLCYWLKAQTVKRPNRQLLEDTKRAWIQEWSSYATITYAAQEEEWSLPLDIKPLMSPEEIKDYENPAYDDTAREKVLKQAVRRVEQEIFNILATRGLQEPLRANPKLKEKGLLDLK